MERFIKDEIHLETLILREINVYGAKKQTTLTHSFVSAGTCEPLVSGRLQQQQFQSTGRVLGLQTKNGSSTKTDDFVTNKLQDCLAFEASDSPRALFC